MEPTSMPNEEGFYRLLPVMREKNTKRKREDNRTSAYQEQGGGELFGGFLSKIAQFLRPQRIQLGLSFPRSIVWVV